MTIFIKCEQCKHINRYNHLKQGDPYKCKYCDNEGEITREIIIKEEENEYELKSKTGTSFNSTFKSTGKTKGNDIGANADTRRNKKTERNKQSNIDSHGVLSEDEEVLFSMTQGKISNLFFEGMLSTESIIVTDSKIYSNNNLISVNSMDFVRGSTVIPNDKVSIIGFYHIKKFRYLLLSIIFGLLGIGGCVSVGSADNFITIGPIVIGIIFFIIYHATQKHIFAIGSSGGSIGISVPFYGESKIKALKKALGDVIGK